ncbi:MAG: methylated-DNA--[protein]-cysteine S-methyltransferase [Candidatus Methylomirabilales bacterium]
MRESDALYQLLKTTRGWVAVAYTDRGILALTLPVETSARALETLQDKVSFPLAQGQGYGKLARDLDRYFRGEAVSFNYPLDLTTATPFQQRVWAALRGIPHGATQVYQEVAKMIGMPRAARAVGQAVGANPIPLLIPCHRVVASDGSLGGFAWGLTWKRHLLQVEGIAPASKRWDCVEGRRW